MEALTPTRLAALVDDKKLHAQLLKIAALAAPVAALQASLVENPAVDYKEDKHEEATYIKDMTNLLKHLLLLSEASLEFGAVLESVEQYQRRINRRKEHLRQMKSSTANPRLSNDKRLIRHPLAPPFDSSDDEYVKEEDPLQIRLAMVSNDRNSGSSDAKPQISVPSDGKSVARSEDMDVITSSKNNMKIKTEHVSPLWGAKGETEAGSSMARRPAVGMTPGKPLLGRASQRGLSVSGVTSGVKLEHEEAVLWKREDEAVLIKREDEENVPAKRVRKA